MYSVYKLNKRGDNIQSWCNPFPIWNQFIVPCPVLTIACWSACRFFRKQIRWSGILISLRIFHSLFWSTQPRLLCIQWNTSRCFSRILLLFLLSNSIWHLISGSSAFSKSSFTSRSSHVLWKPSLKINTCPSIFLILFSGYCYYNY